MRSENPVGFRSGREQELHDVFPAGLLQEAPCTHGLCDAEQTPAPFGHVHILCAWRTFIHPLYEAAIAHRQVVDAQTVIRAQRRCSREQVARLCGEQRQLTGLVEAVDQRNQVHRQFRLQGQRLGQFVQAMFLLLFQRPLQFAETHQFQVALIHALEQARDHLGRGGHRLHHQVLQYLPDDGPDLELRVTEIALERHIQFDHPLGILQQTRSKTQWQHIDVGGMLVLPFAELQAIDEQVVLRIDLTVADGCRAFIPHHTIHSRVRGIPMHIRVQWCHHQAVHHQVQVHIAQVLGIEDRIQHHLAHVIQRGRGGERCRSTFGREALRPEFDVRDIVTLAPWHGMVLVAKSAVMEHDAVRRVIAGGDGCAEVTDVIGQQNEVVAFTGVQHQAVLTPSAGIGSQFQEARPIVSAIGKQGKTDVQAIDLHGTQFEMIPHQGVQAGMDAIDGQQMILLGVSQIEVSELHPCAERQVTAVRIALLHMQVHIQLSGQVPGQEKVLQVGQ